MSLRLTVPALLLVIVAVHGANAQTTAFSLAYDVDISALSRINPNTDKPAPKNGCATQPLTHDAKIWSVDISLRPQAPGLTPTPNGGSYVDAMENVFYFMFSGSGPTITLSSARRDYSGSVNTSFAGQATLSFEGLTLADLGDLIEIIGDSPGEISQTFTKSRLTATIYRVSGTKIDNTPERRAIPEEIDRAINIQPSAKNGLSLVLERLSTPTTLSLGTDPFSNRSLGEVRIEATRLDTVQLTMSPTPIPGTVAIARDYWKVALREDSFTNQTFVIEEPCLQFDLAPVLNDNKLITGVDLKGRYDFLSELGTLYSKFRLEGQLPIDSISNALAASTGSNDQTPLRRPYFQRLNITNASGYQKKTKDWVLGAGSFLSYSSTRNQDQIDNHQWQAGGRFQLYAPNVTGMLRSTLPGAGTSPIIFFDIAAMRGSDPLDKKTHVAAVGNISLTVRPSIRASVDLLAKIAKSPGDAFGPYSHFAFGQAQLRFNLSRDWDYLLRYSCGRQDPDYQKFCGWQSGITLALGR